MTDQLLAVLAQTTAVLLDFDGPVTPLLPADRNARLADATRTVLEAAGVQLSESVNATSDHLAVLRFAASNAPATLEAVERTAVQGEVDAARLAVPTPGAADFLAVCHEARRPVIVVSNNSADAVEAYLDKHDLRHLVRQILGRPYGNPSLMKPHPELVRRALAILDEQPQSCVMIGDSVTDIVVSQTAGVRSIGYAKTPERGIELQRAGADAVTTDMTALAEAVRRSGTS
ncbi:HAD family hydrolase [Kribbella speibonae]|uniref:HAD family phosphatase n=1 Tax=Kribbella speibonae TaxID=1572660 RepID=A0ABY1ZX02_9ACTN|nr:HAD family phosphatase [Kribbella speibonae]TCC19419.1 HAD family phosphatase [Kribbella speibonae]